MAGVGFSVPQLGPHVDREVLRTFAERAEVRGFTSLWVQDHLFYPVETAASYAGQAGRTVPEQYRTLLSATESLSALAAWTRTITIGTSILVAGYHRPVDIAKRLATIDVLSGGRLVAGFGIGWSPEEHDQMDVDFRARGRRADELIEAIRACWGEDPVEFHGEFFDIPRALVSPKPVQRPRPKLLSGMFSEAGRRRTAKLFDIWNPTSPLDVVVPQLKEINAWRAEGEEPVELYWRIFMEPPGGATEARPLLGVDGIASQVAKAEEAGVAEVILDANFWGEIASPQAWIELPDRVADALGM
ncbi:TIGR03619 family F420-dependent LLM class oxidoreductase [Actinomadura sp. KC345]|uniref:TIGR03619 family F420-dependent LLM class oxidoreductase n=1 Tax=Actinomadura sp. KC345 TaxID=2530371 RepID=UPI00104AFA64|nr:TIGR03619 family F420-dependent LLM class oxidoreductase [Actinomadura sp. KC345]TDC55499.1 TIGR03619 family F420-dependent LLM class oxidoreductase [Actinomadura sp. KC345]